MASKIEDRDMLIAWAAGFFEGEGHVKFVNREGKASGSFFSVEVAQVHREPLDRLCDLFGGKVYGPYGPYTSNRQAYYQYVAYSTTAKKAIEEMLPYLYRKGEQCIEALNKWEQYLESK